MYDKKRLKHLLSSLINLVDSSESKYISGDYKGALIDKRIARKIIIDNKNIIELESRYKEIIRSKIIKPSKYDLIQDYKKRIDDIKKKDIIEILESKSESKYMSGDFKGAIIALRRAEKYY